MTHMRELSTQKRYRNMNLKERVNQLFEQYSVNLQAMEQEDATQPEATELETETEAEELMASKKLANGTEIFTDGEFAVGADVFVMNDEGEKIPLPDGEYEYEDGGKTRVEGGKIAEIMDATEAEKDEDKEEMAEEAPETVMTADAVRELVKEALTEALTEYKQELEAHKTELSAIKEELDNQPATEGLSRAPHTQQREPINLRGLSAKDRVSAIFEYYND